VTDASVSDAAHLDGAVFDASPDGGSVDASQSGPAMYVAVGYAGRRVISSDGTVWAHDVHDPQPVMGDNDQLLRGIAYGNGVFVAVGGGSLVGRINYSGDGISWSDASDMGGWIGGVAYHNGLWVAVGGNARHLLSHDGRSWVADPARNYNHHYRAIAYGNGVYVAVGDGGMRALTSDGSTFTNAISAGDGLEAIAFGNGVFVAVGANGRRIISIDGIAWTHDTGGGSTLTGLAFANGMFVATGGGRSLTSGDGITWSEHTMIPSIDALTFGAGLFVGVGWVDRRLTSMDGIAWTQRASDNGFALTSITYGGGP
jgi:hypothetical protein